jgi:glutaredoxin-related protein
MTTYTKAIIYSKDNCPYCVKAKNMLNIKGIPYEELVLGRDYTKEELLELLPNVKTVPQIFLERTEREYVGGCDDLEKRFKPNEEGSSS